MPDFNHLWQILPASQAGADAVLPGLMHHPNQEKETRWKEPKVYWLRKAPRANRLGLLACQDYILAGYYADTP